MIIAHASESLSTDEPGFVHAVGLAARSGATVRGIHVRRPFAALAIPDAAALLERWGKPAKIDHAWMISEGADDPADALLDVLGSLRPALLIAATHARTGLGRLFLGSVAEGVARNAGLPVLFLPTGGPTLVDAQTGALRLERALVLAGPREDSERALAGLSSLTAAAAVDRCGLELLHVYDGTPALDPKLPSGFTATWHRASGPIERAVAERARGYDPQLVVMASRGHDQLSDVVLSSHTERVLHEVRLPLLWVPAQPAP